MIDLHIHTTCSDGRETPEAIVHHAHGLGLSAIAITDHDTVSGITLAQAATNGDMRVIPGIELSAVSGESPVHILGYGVDPTNESLLNATTRITVERRERAGEIVRHLRGMNVGLTLDMVEDISGQAPITRAHIAYALIGNNFVRNAGEAFGRYLSNAAPAFVPQRTLSPEQAIDAIRRSGGVPVLAHPGVTRRDELIPALVQDGLGGIEIFHPNHARPLIRAYQRIAIKHGIVTTGGSDAHDLLRMSQIVETAPVPRAMLDALDRAIADIPRES